MRISSSSLMQCATENIRTNLEKYQDLQLKISSGGQMQRPSEDPLSYSYASRLKDAKAQINQYSQSARLLTNNFELYEDAFGNATEILREIRTDALEANNGTTDDEGRRSIALDVNNKLSQLISVANTEANGKFIFAGSSDGSKPYAFEQDEDMITSVDYGGDTTKMQKEIGYDNNVITNYHGEEVFSNQSGNGIDIFKEIIEVRDAILSGDQDRIGSHLNNVDTALTQISDFRTANGNTIRHVTNMEMTWNQMDVQYAKDIEDTTKYDLVELVNGLHAQEIVYRSSLYTGSLLSRISLLEYLR